MKCQLCNENAATVSFRQVIDGNAEELHVCQECAVTRGLEAQLTIPLLTDFIFGSTGKQSSIPAVEKKTCPSCHLTVADFQKTSRLGCEVCYQSFAEDIEPLLVSMHSSLSHAGKVPVRRQSDAELASLQTALRKAVADQNFEDAAKLRDQVQELLADRGGKT